MPPFNSLTREQQDDVYEEIFLKIAALEAASRKLRKRRETVADLSTAERLLIQLERARIESKIEDWEDRLDALELSNKSVTPPSSVDLNRMKKRVATIRKINVSNKTANAIVKATVAISGSLQRRNLT